MGSSMTSRPAGSGRSSDIVGYTQAEVASRAGVDPELVDRLCELGLLTAAPDGFTEGDVRRARILQSLGTAGMPLDAVAEGVRRGIVDLGFVDDPAYALFTGLTDETFAAAAARTGIPFEVLAAMREAAGAPPPRPEDRLRELEMDALPAIELQIRNGIRSQAVERLLRAMGDSLRRRRRPDRGLRPPERGPRQRRRRRGVRERAGRRVRGHRAGRAEGRDRSRVAQRGPSRVVVGQPARSVGGADEIENCQRPARSSPSWRTALASPSTSTSVVRGLM